MIIPKNKCFIRYKAQVFQLQRNTNDINKYEDKKIEKGWVFTEARDG